MNISAEYNILYYYLLRKFSKGILLFSRRHVPYIRYPNVRLSPRFFIGRNGRGIKSRGSNKTELLNGVS